MNEVRNIDRVYPGRYPVSRNVKKTTASTAIEGYKEETSERRQSRDRRRSAKKKVLFERRLNKRRTGRIDVTA